MWISELVAFILGCALAVSVVLVHHVWLCYRIDLAVRRETGSWWSIYRPGSWRWLKGCFR